MEADDCKQFQLTHGEEDQHGSSAKRLQAQLTMLAMESFSCLVVSAVSALAFSVSFLFIASATLFSIILHCKMPLALELMRLCKAFNKHVCIE